MIKIIHLSTIFIFVLLACATHNDIKKDIMSLNTHDKKEEFLLELFKNDQYYRISLGDTVLKYGYLSNNHQAFLKEMSKQDSLNFEMVKMYIDTYKYPSQKEFSDLANTCMLYVVGHNGNFAKQKLVFNYFYNAYIYNDLDEVTFLFLVNEMYESKHHVLFNFNNNYTYKERIEILIKVLDLD